MNVLPFLLGFLVGKANRQANKEPKRLLTADDLKGNWAIIYGGIVALIVLLSQLCAGDALELSLHSHVPRYVGVLALVSPYVAFVLVVFLQFGMIGKFEMSSRTTETFLFEPTMAIVSMWLLWYGFHIGLFEHLHWGWKLLVCFAPAVVFVFSSRVAEFFRRPAVRAELRNFGAVLSMGFTVWLFDLIGQMFFGRSFLAEFVALLP